MVGNYTFTELHFSSKKMFLSVHLRVFFRPLAREKSFHSLAQNWIKRTSSRYEHECSREADGNSKHSGDQEIQEVLTQLLSYTQSRIHLTIRKKTSTSDKVNFRKMKASTSEKVNFNFREQNFREIVEETSREIYIIYYVCVLSNTQLFVIG